MKQHEFEIAGRINNDGRLSMYMQELNEFTKKWKNSRIIAIFKVYEPGTSEALKGYYYNCVVPAFQRALWESGDRMTKEKTEEYLRRKKLSDCRSLTLKSLADSYCSLSVLLLI